MDQIRLGIKRLWVIFLLMAQLGWASESYVTAHLMGQFGNQLFIMAAAISLALDHGALYTFPDLIKNTHPTFNISLNYQKIFYRLNAFEPLKPCHFLYYEPCFSYHPIPYHPNMCLVGWFQSEKYFAHHREEILQLFSPPPEIMDYLNEQYDDVIQHPNTVAIHMRSYLTELPEVSRCYAHLGGDYVKRAMEIFPEDAIFIVFSNDMEWCKKQLAPLTHSRSIRFIEGESHYHDFYLMSLCKHQIMSNSTFSWWAAYLNSYPHKIVAAPSAWFSSSYVRDTKDLIPDSWIVID